MRAGQTTQSFETSRARYPLKMKPAGVPARLRRWIFWTLLASCALCAMLNLLIGGFPWCLYVLLSAYIFYGVFVTQSLVDASIMGKLWAMILSASALLLLIGYLEGGQWALKTVVPMVLFGGVCTGTALYLPKQLTQRPYLFPYFSLLLAGILFPVTVMTIAGHANWACVVLFCASNMICILLSVFHRASILQELRKKTSTK